MTGPRRFRSTPSAPGVAEGAGVLGWAKEAGGDAVSHPQHYTSHPSGVECITVTEHMGFLIGNAMKYLWRADLKHDAIEDMRKAIWYIQREIEKRERA
jgi:hypothetical protein